MWEYKILVTENPTASEEQLNEMGKGNWSLVCIVPWSSSWYYYFQREREN